MIKILKVIFISMFFVLLCGSINVDAKTIIVHDHTGGPEGSGGGVSTLTLSNSEYYIYIDETSKIGYLINSTTEEEIIIGTCKVILIDDSNNEEYIWCLANENSLGTIEVSTINDTQIITNIDGEIENMITCGSVVSIIE